MRLRDYIPPAVRRVIGGVYRIAGRRLRRSPIDVVKANTKEAFDYFYRQDDFIDACYLEPGRLALYELVADYCADLVASSSAKGTIRIADIGCGTGNMLEALRRRLYSERELEMFGLDFAASAVARAAKLLPMATFVVEDIYANKLPTDFFDIVLCLETLEHLRWPEKALVELQRICKPEANIVITVPNGAKDSWDGHVNFWDVAQLKHLLSPRGLVEIKLLQDDTVIMVRLTKSVARA